MRFPLFCFVFALTLPLRAAASANALPIPTPIDMHWLDGAWAEADSVTFFEGLPGPGEGAEVFKTEVLRVPTLTIDEQYFYARPLTLSAVDQTRIGEILRSNWFIVPPTTAGILAKFCGGFHADIGVRLAKGDKLLAYVLICFGCHEIRFVHEDQRIEADLTPKGYSSFRDILIAYRQERPVYRAPKVKMPPLPLPPPPKVELKL